MRLPSYSLKKTFWIALLFALAIITAFILLVKANPTYLSFNEENIKYILKYCSNGHLIVGVIAVSILITGAGSLLIKRFPLLNIYSLTFFLSLGVIAAISYANIESSILINHFLFISTLKKLKMSYHLFTHYHIYDFLVETLAFHQGDSESSGATAYYLIPLFLFLRMLGGLNLFNLYLSNISLSILSLVLFYYLVSSVWSEKEALSGALLWGTSFWFQDFARSETYVTPSIVIALILLILWYAWLNTSKNLPYLILGIVTGLAMYYYGMLRFFIIIPGYIFFKRNWQDKSSIALFTAGFLLLMLPGVVLRLQYGGRFFDEEHFFLLAPGHEYGEPLIDYFSKTKINIFSYIYKTFIDNLTVFRNMTNMQHGDCYDPYQAHIIQRVLLFPFFLGLLHSFKRRQEIRYSFLLLLTVIIFILPLFITANCSQIRRNVLWPIPLYILIGIGIGRVVFYINNLRIIFVKKILITSLIAMCLWISLREIRHTMHNMWYKRGHLGHAWFKKNWSIPEKGNLIMIKDLKEIFQEIDEYLISSLDAKQEKHIEDIFISPDGKAEMVVYYDLERIYPQGDFDVTRYGDFETGTLEGWAALGEAFAFQPTYEDNTYFRGHKAGANIQGQYWIGTHEKRPDESFGRGSIQGDQPIGTLTSRAFVITKPYISFLIGGGERSNTRIELLIDKKVIRFVTGFNSETMRRIRWNVSQYKGLKARICVVDYSRMPWGHISFDDLRFEDFLDTD